MRSSVTSGIDMTAAPNILANQGWRFVSKVKSSARSNKPGLLASHAAAALDLRLLPIQNNIAGKSTARVQASVHRPAASTVPPRRDPPVGDPPVGDLQAGIEDDVKLSIRYLASYERQARAM